jgi:hypothetical protein
VPPKLIRQLRNLTPYRKTQVQERAREVNRLHKALDDAGIKLDCVAADIMGKSGSDMLDALVAGTTDPDVLADRARRQMAWCASKCPSSASRNAVIFLMASGRKARHVNADLGEDASGAAALDTDHGAQPLNRRRERAQLLLDGVREPVDLLVVEVDVREDRPDPLASWAGRCPGNDQSAGKRRSGEMRNGSKWLDFVLEEAAMAAIRVKANHSAAQYQRLRPRRGHRRALGGQAHVDLRDLRHARHRRDLRDLGPDYFSTATANARPSASSNGSNASDTASRSSRPRQPERTCPARQKEQRGREHAALSQDAKCTSVRPCSLSEDRPSSRGRVWRSSTRGCLASAGRSRRRASRASWLRISGGQGVADRAFARCGAGVPGLRSGFLNVSPAAPI